MGEVKRNESAADVKRIRARLVDSVKNLKNNAPGGGVEQSVYGERGRWREISGQGAGTDNSVRRRVLLQGFVAAVAATILVFWLKKHLAFGVFLFLLSLFFTISAFIGGSLPGKIDKFGKWLGYAIGQFLTYLLLIPFFVLCMVPARLVLKFRGIDPMKRKFEKDAASYWTDRKRPQSADYFKRQF